MSRENNSQKLRRLSELTTSEKQNVLKLVDELVWFYSDDTKTGILYWVHEMFLAYMESEYSELDGREAASKYRCIHNFMQEVFTIFREKCCCNRLKNEDL